MENIGDILIQARKKKGMTQGELAERIGSSRQAISKWENNETKPDIEKLFKLCDVLEVTIEDFNLPQREKKKYKMNYAWLLSAVCLLIGIGIGYLLSTNLTPNEIPDDIILKQNLTVENYMVSYTAITREKILNYEISCYYEDEESSKMNEVKADIEEYKFQCIYNSIADASTNIYVKMKHKGNERLFYKSWFKIIDEHNWIWKEK